MKLLRLSDVIIKTGLKKAAIYDRIQKGVFPSPIKIGPRISAWPDYEVDRIIAAWISNTTEENIKNIVTTIHEERKYALQQFHGNQ